MKKKLFTHLIIAISITSWLKTNQSTSIPPIQVIVHIHNEQGNKQSTELSSQQVSTPKISAEQNLKNSAPEVKTDPIEQTLASRFHFQKICIGALIATFITTTTYIAYLHHQLTTKKSWSLWKQKIPLHELALWPTTNLYKELLRSIALKYHKNHKMGKDLSPFRLFYLFEQETENELQTLRHYEKLKKIASYLFPLKWLISILERNQTVQIDERRSRLSFIRSTIEKYLYEQFPEDALKFK